MQDKTNKQKNYLDFKFKVGSINWYFPSLSLKISLRIEKKRKDHKNIKLQNELKDSQGQSNLGKGDCGRKETKKGHHGYQ